MQIMRPYQLQKQGATIVHHVFWTEGLKLFLATLFFFISTLLPRHFRAIIMYMMHRLLILKFAQVFDLSFKLVIYLFCLIKLILKQF